MQYSHLVAGAGLEGLVCALTLSNTGEKVILIDARQEIGDPVNGIGYTNHQSTHDWIIKMNPPDQLQLQEHPGGWGLRLEWLEKLLCQRAGEAGVDIRVKTRIVGWRDGQQGKTIEMKGAGHGNPQFISAKYFHDCLGDQPFTDILPGQDGNSGLEGGRNVLGRKIRTDLIQWSGAIASPLRIPKEWTHPGWDGERLAFPRADGTIECWMRGATCEPQHPNGWLKIISANRSADHRIISIDTAISRGIEKAIKFKKQL